MNLPDMSDANGRKRGSIALARQLCYEIAGATSEDDMDGGGYGSVDIAEILSAEVVRLQKALAKPEQEPVAWMFQHDETGRMNYVSNDGIHNPTTFIEMNPRYALVCPLYTAPPQQQAEPVAWAVQACSKMWRGEFAEIDAKAEAKRIGGTCVAYPLYTAQREWQSLTDEDWEKVVNRKNTVFDTFEQGATWAAYKLERLNT